VELAAVVVSWMHEEVTRIVVGLRMAAFAGPVTGDVAIFFSDRDHDSSHFSQISSLSSHR
jgi:hypothetical protein